MGQKTSNPNAYAGVTGIDSLAGGSIYEPQRTGTGTLYIQGLLFGFDASKALELSLASATIPSPSRNTTPIPMGNTVVHYSGNTVLSGFSAVFRDYVDRRTADALELWDRLHYNPETNAKGFKADYCRQGWLKMYAPEGTTDKTSGLGDDDVYNLVNIQMAGYQRGELQKGNDDMRFFSVEFAVDRCIRQINNQ